MLQFQCWSCVARAARPPCQVYGVDDGLFCILLPPKTTTLPATLCFHVHVRNYGTILVVSRSSGERYWPICDAIIAFCCFSLMFALCSFGCCCSPVRSHCYVLLGYSTFAGNFRYCISFSAVGVGFNAESKAKSHLASKGCLLQGPATNSAAAVGARPGTSALS